MISPNGIAAILFDLDGTLRESRPHANDVTFDFAKNYINPLSNADRRNALRWAHRYWADSPTLKVDAQAFEKGSEAFWENYSMRHLMAFGCPPEQASEIAPLLIQHFAENYNPENHVPLDVPVTLAALQESGYIMGIVSNRDESCEAELEELGLLSFFDFNLVAGQVNSWKPDDRIFACALEQAGTTPENTLYIGDNYYADIIGANRAGLNAILIDPDDIFPDATCPVVRSIGELLGMLSHNGSG